MSNNKNKTNTKKNETIIKEKKKFTPKAPYETVWGKILLIVLLAGMVMAPIAGLIYILLGL